MGEMLITSNVTCAGALSCWKMKNSVEIWRTPGRNCCNNISVRLILLTYLDSVIDKCQTGVMSTTCYSPTDAVSDWTLIVCAQCRRFAKMSFFLVDGFTYTFSHSGGFFGVVAVHVLSLANKMTLTSFLSTNISQGSLATRLRRSGILISGLQEVYCYVCRWKNFENRSAFGKVSGKSRMTPFFRTRCIFTFCESRRRREMYSSHGRLPVCLSVCLSVAAFSRYCTDPYITWGDGTGSL